MANRAPTPAPADLVGISKAQFFEMIAHKPHRGQQLYHDSEARFRVAACGRRYGKSRMIGKDEEYDLLKPKRLTWIVGPTYDLGEKEFRVMWDDLIIKLGLGRSNKVRKSYNKRQGDMFIELPWGSRVEVRSADNPASLVGDALDKVIMSEAAKHNRETWDRYIRPALTDRRGRADFGSTPEGWNWFHDIFGYGRDPSPDYKDYESWQFPAWDNPYLFPLGELDPEIALLKLTMTKEEFDQEIAALFTAFAGKIFGEWSEEVHVTHVPFDPSLSNYGSFDWGWTNPLCFLEFQIGPDDQIRIWREHYKSHMTLQDHLAYLNGRTERGENPPGYHINLCFGDAEDPGNIMQVCTDFAPCIGDNEAKVDWRRGINLIAKFLKMRQVGVSDEYGTPLEQPGLVCDFSCANFRREMNNYKRKPGATGNDMRGSVVTTGDNHAIDPLRYGLMHLFVLGANAHLTDLYSLEALRSGHGNGMLLPTAPGNPPGDLWTPSDRGIFTMNVEF